VTFKYIMKVSGEVKIIVRFLKDSIKDRRVTKNSICGDMSRCRRLRHCSRK